MTDQLTNIENTKLQECEQIIEKGLQTFYAVGTALLSIRDDRLYRQTHLTFEAYCKERWQITDRRARQFINAVAIVDNLTPIGLGYVNQTGTTVPEVTEFTIRPLAPFPPDEQREIWREVQERSNGKPTAKTVISVVNERSSKLNQGMYSNVTDQWYTPDKIIDRVLKLFGEIDIDPCSNPGKPNVPANKHYTEVDNGFDYEWPGKVYLNPPYGNVIGNWVHRLIHQYDMDITTEAIALLPARTDTDWFEPLFNYPICFIHGRLIFKGGLNSAPFPSVVVYFGTNIKAFKMHFSDLGTIVKRL